MNGVPCTPGSQCDARRTPRPDGPSAAAPDERPITLMGRNEFQALTLHTCEMIEEEYIARNNVIYTLKRHLQNPWMEGLRRSALRCVWAMIRLSGPAIGVRGEMPVFQSGI